MPVVCRVLPDDIENELQVTAGGVMADLGGVLLGGVLALVGGGVAQYLTHSFSSQRERAKLIREKAELLCEKLLEVDEWLVASRYHTSKDNDAGPPSPMCHAQMLQALYFPELGEEIGAVADCAMVAMDAIGEERKAIVGADHDVELAGLQGKDSAHAIANRLAISQHHHEAILAVLKPCFAARARAVNRVGEILKAHT